MSNMPEPSEQKAEIIPEQGNTDEIITKIQTLISKISDSPNTTIPKEFLPLFGKSLLLKALVQTSAPNKLSISEGTQLSGLLASISQNPEGKSPSKIEQVIYYNSLGIINLKAKKFSAAKYFFSLCHKLITSEGENEDSNTDIILNQLTYNISLCNFYLKQYDKCYKVLSELKNSKYMANNPYIYFRCALCCIENERIEKVDDNLNNLVSKILVEPNNEEKFRGVVLINNEIEKSTEMDILYSNDNLNEAVNNLKQCILLTKNERTFEKKILNLDLLLGGGIDDVSIQYEKLQSLAMEFLLYCLLKNGSFTEIILYATEYLKNKNLTRRHRSIITNDIVFSYIKLGQVDEALAFLSKEIEKESLDMKDSFEGNGIVYSKISWKIALYVNMTKIHFLKGELEESKKFIDNILETLEINKKNSNESEIPGCILNLVIYYLLLKKDLSTAYSIIKYRKIPQEYFHI